MNATEAEYIKKQLSSRHDTERCKCDLCLIKKFKRNPGPRPNLHPATTPPPPQQIKEKYRRFSQLYKS